MTNKEITKVIFNNAEISALYYGDVLIWKKGNGSQSGDLNFSGVFNDTVTGSNNTVTATFEDGTTETINIPYDSTTKEFNYTFEKPLERMALNNKTIYKTITHIPNQSNLIDCKYYFYECSADNIDLSNFNTASVTNMSGMFRNCQGLTTLDVSNFDTSKVTNMSEMFNSCNGLTTLDVSNFDTSKVTNMSRMFCTMWGLTSLNLGSNFDTSKVTNMSEMFRNSYKLSSLDLSSFDTANVTDMSEMFDGLKLTSLDLSSFDTANCTTMYYMFCSSDHLTTLNLGNFNTSNVIDMKGMFIYCTSLANVTGVFEGTKVNLDFQYSPLTNASAMVFINGLANVTETKKFTFNSTTYNTLTPEQIATATSKGWTVISA